ncbi:MAG: sigma-54-dependent transcriptional regulator [Rhodothalassiaceae bacterium]
MAARILIVDDEPTQRVLLRGVLTRDGHTVEEARNGAQAVARLTDGATVDAMMLDLMMPQMDGMAVLEAIRPQHPDLPVIVLTAHASVNRVVDAMRAGASDFLAKPASPERIRQAVAAALKRERLVGEVDGLAEHVGRSGRGFKALVGDAPAMCTAIDAAARAARSTVPVLIEGESGVGKEVFARAIHEESARVDRPFIAVNCGAIPSNLVESILFGHEKGAFTGAQDKHLGKFQEADGGTLFLDEVGELPLDIQVKLLRALQEREIDPLGARRPVKIDIRLISATNRPLQQMVADGAFREDLFYRLNVFPLRLPPLRERRADIPALADHFAARVAEAEGLPRPQLTPDALERLRAMDWPGNIRQLQNAMFRAVILADGPDLHADAFEVLEPKPRIQPAAPAEDIQTPARPSLALEDEHGHVRPLADLEREAIAHAMARYDRRMSEVARRLGIGRSTLYRKLEDLAAEPEPETAPPGAARRHPQ